MGRSNRPILSEAERKELEDGYRNHEKHSYRQQCKIILLKADGRTSEEVAAIMGTCIMTVNNWVNRYKEDRIAGLGIKPGRGRKPKTVLDKQQDEQALRKAIQENRQRLDLAKQDFESLTGKTVTKDAMRAFLKVVVQDINV